MQAPPKTDADAKAQSESEARLKEICDLQLILQRQQEEIQWFQPANAAAPDMEEHPDLEEHTESEIFFDYGDLVSNALDMARKGM